MQDYTVQIGSPPLAQGLIDLDTSLRSAEIAVDELSKAHFLLIDSGLFLVVSTESVADIVRCRAVDLYQSGRLFRIGSARGAIWFGVDITGLDDDFSDKVFLFDAFPKATTAKSVPDSVDKEPAPFTVGTADGDIWQSVRNLSLSADATIAQMAVIAMMLFRWHRDNRFCGRCAAPMRVAEAGWNRLCDCGNSCYPRIDPAVIVALLDADNRLFLAHNALWPGVKVSLLAGYVEAGETLEAAVKREVFEESALVVKSVRYLTSQAWPYPRSLMIGCVGRVESTEFDLSAGELAWGRWVSAGEVDTLVKEGVLALPAAVSIAAHIVSAWRLGQIHTW